MADEGIHKSQSGEQKHFGASQTLQYIFPLGTVGEWLCTSC